MWRYLVHGRGQVRPSTSEYNALINPVTPCVPLCILNIQYKSFAVFKGSKIGVVERTSEITQIDQVAAVEPTTGKVVEVSESKR